MGRRMKKWNANLFLLLVFFFSLPFFANHIRIEFLGWEEEAEPIIIAIRGLFNLHPAINLESIRQKSDFRACSSFILKFDQVGGLGNQMEKKTYPQTRDGCEFLKHGRKRFDSCHPLGKIKRRIFFKPQTGDALNQHTKTHKRPHNFHFTLEPKSFVWIFALFFFL